MKPEWRETGAAANDDAFPRTRHAALVFILITLVLDMLALGMIVPMLPKLVEDFVHGDTARAAYIVGVFGTVWALVQGRAKPWVVPDEAFDSQTRAFAERLANGPTLAYAAGKRIVRAYLDGGVRAADRVVDRVALALFDSEDMRAGVAGVLKHGARNFRDKVVFQGR